MLWTLVNLLQQPKSRTNAPLEASLLVMIDPIPAIYPKMEIIMGCIVLAIILSEMPPVESKSPRLPVPSAASSLESLIKHIPSVIDAWMSTTNVGKRQCCILSVSI